MIESEARGTTFAPDLVVSSLGAPVSPAILLLTFGYVGFAASFGVVLFRHPVRPQHEG